MSGLFLARRAPTGPRVPAQTRARRGVYPLRLPNRPRKTAGKGARQLVPTDRPLPIFRHAVARPASRSPVWAQRRRLNRATTGRTTRRTRRPEQRRDTSRRPPWRVHVDRWRAFPARLGNCATTRPAIGHLTPLTRLTCYASVLCEQVHRWVDSEENHCFYWVFCRLVPPRGIEPLFRCGLSNMRFYWRFDSY